MYKFIPKGVVMDAARHLHETEVETGADLVDYSTVAAVTFTALMIMLGALVLLLAIWREEANNLRVDLEKGWYRGKHLKTD